MDAHLSELINDLLLMNEIHIDEKYENESGIAMAKKVSRDYFILSGLTRSMTE